MLISHTAIYGLARGVPGLINLVALVLFTRLLSAEEYGLYSVVLAGVGLVQVMGFQWLNLCLSRFLPAHQKDSEHFVSKIKYLFFVVAILFIAIGFIVYLLLPEMNLKPYLALSIPLILTQVWLELSLTYYSVSLQPKYYGQINLVKSLVALVIGACLAWFGFGGFAPLWGLLIGSCIALFIFRNNSLMQSRASKPKVEETKKLYSYALPLAINFALVWVITSSDRLLLVWLLDAQATGQYTAGYNLANFSVNTILVIVNLAAYPLVVRAFELEGETAAQLQLGKNGAVLFSLAFVAAAEVFVLAPLLGKLLVGEEFQNSVVDLLPWIALGTALSGLKTYHFDVAFHLRKKTKKLVFISIAAALFNILLNLWWIPIWGIMGAAYATVVTFVIALITSAYMAQLSFRMPQVLPLVAQALFIALPTALVTWLVTHIGDWLGLIFGLVVGVLMAVICAVCIDLAGIRSELRQFMVSR